MAGKKSGEEGEVPGVKTLEYHPLSEVVRWPRNPKSHDLGQLHLSVNRFGFIGAILMDDRSGRLVAGHGRLEMLIQKRDAGETPPRGIIARDGDWHIPVIREWFNSDAEAEAYLIADNRHVELGGWDEAELLELLKVQVEEGGLEGTGYDADDMDAILRNLLGDQENGNGAGEPPEENAPSDTQAQIGAFRFPIGRDVYTRWVEEIRQDVGFDDESIIGEIRRRLKL